MLYTEDTYEIEGRPYFGYMRGRYNKDEIRELDAYAIKLGIELIPCIQVLGHLATHLRWHATAPYRDTTNVLLVGAKETYELIDDMFKTISECFTSKRIHIGMDETKDLGTGAYLDKFGVLKLDAPFVAYLVDARVALVNLFTVSLELNLTVLINKL
jgi:N-acetyl-beta-hexosaminidase